MVVLVAVWWCAGSIDGGIGGGGVRVVLLVVFMVVWWCAGNIDCGIHGGVRIGLMGYELGLWLGSVFRI